MRYNAFFGELPINAFKPRPDGRMTLEGGGNPVSAVTDAISGVLSGVGDVVGGALDTAGNVVGGAADFVTEHPLEAAALVAGGYYFAPEVGAWFNPQADFLIYGSEAGVPAGTTLPANVASQFTSELPAGYAPFVQPEVTTLGNVAGTTEGMASGTAADLGSNVGLQAAPGQGLNLASTTGAPGLQTGGLGTSLADMGGAQGLTTAGATGGILGASGLNATNAATMAGLGAAGLTGANGIGSTLGGIDTGAAGLGAAAGAAGAGNTLADILPYTAGAGVVSGLLGANAATNAAQIQADAAAKAQAQQQANFETINKQQAPYRASGYGALNQLAGMGSGATTQYDASGNPIGPVTGATDYLTHQFNAADLAAGLAPNYDFMLQQGQMANQRAGNVGGGALSGNTLQGLQKYTQDYAGNAYQNAFTNYQNQRSNIYNTLAGIAGIGQTGQTATNTAATNLANANAQLGVGSAAAQAAGGTGAANAYTNALNNVTNQYTLASLLNQGGRVA
jgi:hypothetical protein